MPEWLEGVFIDCEAALEGRNLHRRLEMEPENLSEFGLGPIHAREIALIGPHAGISCPPYLAIVAGCTPCPGFVSAVCLLPVAAHLFIGSETIPPQDGYLNIRG